MNLKHHVLLRVAGPVILLAGLTGCGTAGADASAALGAGSTTAAGPTARTAKMNAVDQTLMSDIAQAHIAEIQIGGLASSRSQNPQVRAFAQRMVDDHTAALQELQSLARSKGVNLPQNTDLMHRALAVQLGTLSGPEFDRQYMSQAGVNDHKRTHELLQATAQAATDPDLRAYAGKTLTVVSSHLDAAVQSSGK